MAYAHPDAVPQNRCGFRLQSGEYCGALSVSNWEQVDCRLCRHHIYNDPEAARQYEQAKKSAQ